MLCRDLSLAVSLWNLCFCTEDEVFPSLSGAMLGLTEGSMPSGFSLHGSF